MDAELVTTWYAFGDLNSDYRIISTAFYRLN